ncbi:MAG: cation diffusion facilitator family transporter, partial [Actinomycetota bacterium]|nr:cation diffusion facilitator family transporter [Actinomycetota bacterium]
LRAHQRRVLWWVLAANGGFMVVEVVAGLRFRSLALLADATHMGSDVLGLGVALVAQALMARPSSDSHSYGWQRAEVLGAQANAFLLLATTGWIVYEAVDRLGGRTVSVDGAGLLVVAVIGLAVNLGSAVALARTQGASLNMRGAFVHMALDAAGSVAAMVAGLAVLIFGADWVDPVVSMLIAGLVLWAAWGLFRDTTRVLLEATPRGLDPETVSAAIADEPGVTAVHHMHLWSLASDVPALSVHVVVDAEPTLHEAQRRGDAVRTMLAERFGISHATVELECHPCDADEDSHHVDH